MVDGAQMELKWFHVTRFYLHGTVQQRMNSLNANHSPSVSFLWVCSGQADTRKSARRGASSIILTGNFQIHGSGPICTMWTLASFDHILKGRTAAMVSVGWATRWRRTARQLASGVTCSSHTLGMKVGPHPSVSTKAYLGQWCFFFCFSIKLVKCHAFIANFPPGVFDLEENLMKSWPQSCSTAYFCCLSNPQNQPQLIRHLLLTLEASPFYQVLKAEPKQMLLLSNLNTPIHSRLWCVFEAHCAYEMDIQAGVGKDEWWSIVGPGWMVECSMFHGFWGCCMVSKALLRI